MSQSNKQPEQEQGVNDIYLLCPLSDDIVEAIRVESWHNEEYQRYRSQFFKKRAAVSEDDILQELKRRGEASKAGAFIPDSNISEDFFPSKEDWERIDAWTEANYDPLLSTKYVRRQLYWSLDRQEMQKAVANYYGWDSWSEDPWGNIDKFNNWLNNVPDNEMVVWAVNETSGGRVYLAFGTLYNLYQLDFSKMSPEDLLAQIGFGAACFIYIKKYMGWQTYNEFIYGYLEEPLSVQLINERICKVYPFDLTRYDNEDDTPFDNIQENLWLFGYRYDHFTNYNQLVSGAYLWGYALEEALKRIGESPDLAAFLNYHTATDGSIAEICQKIESKDYKIPDSNEAWKKLEQTLEKKLKATAAKYDDVFTLKSNRENGILKESYVEAQEGLLEGVNYWKSKEFKAAIAGLEGRLGNSLLNIVKHDLVDAARKDKKHKSHQLLEKDYQGEGLKLILPDGSATKIKSTKGDINEDKKDESLFERIPNPDLGSEQLLEENEGDTIDLRSLGFDKDDLTLKELLLLEELSDAVSKGYKKDSKEGLPLQQLWGNDYGKKIKMLKRLEAKRKKP